MDKRTIIPFNTNWLYSPTDLSKAYKILFDDSLFEEVVIPHANKVLTKHKGEDFISQIESYRFVSNYRKHFSLENISGKRYFLEFEGVATVCDVYINESFITSHRGAYNSFTVDITDYVKEGENILFARVDSTKHPDIPPEGGNVDYCLFGGIVRNVNLIVTNECYIKDVFLTTPLVSAECAVIRAQVEISSLARVVVEVFDGEGTLVTSAVKECSGTLQLDCPTISSPRLWDVCDPYLYNVKISLYKQNKVDEVNIKYGIRFFEFKTDENDACFYLNGRLLKLRGVNRHEQWPWIGRAVPDKLQKRDADMVKQSGFNSVRCSHYPQSPAFLNRCDEIGLLVFEEAPGWQHTGEGSWQDLHVQNVRNMIIRDRNHPCIITWGVRINEAQDNCALWSRAMNEAKSLDSTRITHGVRMMELYETTEHVEDIFCNNYQYPQSPRFLPFVITEHSMDWWEGNGFSDASDEKAAKFTKSFGDAMDYYYKNPLCAGGFAWSMFDYNNEVNYTKTEHVFPSGLYDLYRLDKPVSHLFESQKDFDDSLVIYIANYWTAQSPSFVEVYSNCEEVELFVNNKSIGRIKPNLYLNIPHGAFAFDNVSFEKGELKAVGYISGKAVCETIRLTPEAASKIVIEPDYPSLTSSECDMTNVSVTLVDKNGTRLPYASDKITFEISGCGEFIGEREIFLEGGRCGCIIKSNYMQEGSIVVKASCNGVQNAECIIEVKKQ